MSSSAPKSACKYLITTVIEKVKLNIAFPVDFVIQWKRGSQKIETKSKIQHSPKNNNFITMINEELSMFACFLFNENSTHFLEKKVYFFF